MTTLMLETIDDDATAVLERAGTVVLSLTPSPLDHDLPFSEITAIITRGMGQLDRALIEACPNLKVVARCGAGLNNLDLAAAADHNIPVVFAPGLNTRAVAEQTLMLMMMSVRSGFFAALEAKIKGDWACRDAFTGDDLNGKKICIVGNGNIGGRVAELCRALSMEVAICGRGGGGIEDLKSALAETLPTSDIVSLHIPLTPDTDKMFDSAMFSAFKPGSVLVNTARGELIETNALIKSLDRGLLAGYAADVLDVEPPVADDPVLAHPNTVITPHVAAMTKNTYREMCLFAAENMVAVLAGETPVAKSIYSGAP